MVVARFSKYDLNVSLFQTFLVTWKILSYVNRDSVIHYLLLIQVSLFIFILDVVVMHSRELNNVSLTAIGFF